MKPHMSLPSYPGGQLIGLTCKSWQGYDSGNCGLCATLKFEGSPLTVQPLSITNRLDIATTLLHTRNRICTGLKGHGLRYGDIRRKRCEALSYNVNRRNVHAQIACCRSSGLNDRKVSCSRFDLRVAQRGRDGCHRARCRCFPLRACLKFV